jgi:hypothetical protein
MGLRQIESQHTFIVGTTPPRFQRFVDRLCDRIGKIASDHVWLAAMGDNLMVAPRGGPCQESRCHLPHRKQRSCPVAVPAVSVNRPTTSASPAAGIALASEGLTSRACMRDVAWGNSFHRRRRVNPLVGQTFLSAGGRERVPCLPGRQECLPHVSRASVAHSDLRYSIRSFCSSAVSSPMPVTFAGLWYSVSTSSRLFARPWWR